MKCPRCGAELNSGAYFCGECGHILKNNTVNDSPIVPPDYSSHNGPDGSQENTQLTGGDTQPVCPTCGFPNKSGSAFCPQCGSRMKPQPAPEAPPQKNRNTLYIVIIIVMSALVIGLISFIAAFVLYNNSAKKEDTESPTAVPIAATVAPATAAPATAEPLPTEEPAMAKQYTFDTTVYRVPLYSSSATYKRMPDIHYTIESSDARLNELAEVIFDFDRCCETYMNDGDGEVFRYLQSGSTAYNQQTNYKSKNPNLKQKYISVEVYDAREYNGYYYVWANEQLEVHNNGSDSNTLTRWVYKLSYGSNGWVINDYTKDPLS